MSSIPQRVLKVFVVKGGNLRANDLYESLPDLNKMSINTAVSILTRQGMLRRTRVYGVKELTELGRTQADYVKPPPKTPEYILQQNRIRYARYLAKRKAAKSLQHDILTRL